MEAPSPSHAAHKVHAAIDHQPSAAGIRAPPFPSHRRRQKPAYANDSLIQAALIERRETRTNVLERCVPFSTIRLLISIFSYALLLSDVIRTGVAIRTLTYTPLEPDIYNYFGPYAYRVAQIASNTTASEQKKLWSYKFDTTSIALRAFAQHWGLTAFPRCVQYEMECTSDMLNADTVFEMLDAVAQATMDQTTSSNGWNGRDPVGITLRTQHRWLDRVHHFVLPQFFVRDVWRTNQALYYPPPILLHPSTVNMCTSFAARPHACTEAWTNFKRSCGAHDTACQQTGLLWMDVIARVGALQALHPNSTIDLTVVESAEDYQTCYGGLAFHARRLYDVVTIIRVRNCVESDSCVTTLVDDYRYEGAMLTSDAPAWFWIVASLRVVAQTYAWLRLAMLFIGVYNVRVVESKYHQSSAINVHWATWTVLAKIPSQVVIYGSPFPIICYVTAHLIDSPAVYETVAQKFTTTLGMFNLHLTEFLTLSAVQMRNVWVMAIILQVIVSIATSRYWSPVMGIVGVPEYSISIVSCLTIVSQLRSLRLRSTKVTKIFEVVPSRRSASFKAVSYMINGGKGNMLMEGILLDIKCLIYSTAICIFLSTMWSLLRHVVTGRTPKSLLWGTSMVPYSAGTLWPTNGLAVCWNSGLLTQPTLAPGHHRSVQPSENVLHTSFHTSMFCLDNEAFFLQRNFEMLEDRRPEVHAIVCLMNVAMVTDPIMFARLRFFGGVSILFLKPTEDESIYVVPAKVRDTEVITKVTWRNLMMLYAVNSKDMPWSDLLQCG